jgi:Stage II sporulation protein E (SpoIIE)/NACHT domain
MREQVRILRVVVASPGDVQAERDVVNRATDEINRGTAADRGLRLEVVRWETDAYPGFSREGPQGHIDPILRIEECNVLVGIFWKRLGTPTKDAKSGTEHEFRRAYESWKKSGHPQIMVYFNQKPYTPQSEEEIDQWGQVLKFRKGFPEEGLWWPYKGTAKFEKLLRTHLNNFLRTEFPVDQAEPDPSLADAPMQGRRPSPVSGQLTDYFALQSAIIEEHSRAFVGRVDAQRAFERFLGTHRRGYFIVRGGPGQGKTAFSSHIVQAGRYVHHFISRTVGWADSRLILRSLLSQLRPIAEWDGEMPDSPSELTKTFEELLPVAVARQNRVVIVIDGLDEIPAASDEELPYLVTDVLPDGVFFVVTSRPGDRLDRLEERLFDIAHGVYELGPLELPEMRAILQSRRPEITEGEVERIAEAAQGNPLYLDAAAHQLEIDPTYNLEALPDSVEGFFRDSTSDLRAGDTILGDVLALLSVARKPLSLRELSKILGKPQREIDERGIHPVRQFLLAADSSYAFYHAWFHEFVTGKILYEDELQRAHRRIADWLRSPESRSSEYRWASLAYHLFESGCREGLIQAIDEKFLAEKVRRLGYAVLEDVELLSRSLLDSDDPDVVERCVSIVEGLRQVVGGDIIRDATNAVQPYRSGPVSFRTRLIESSVQSVRGVDAYVGVLPKAEVAADFFEIVPAAGRLILAIGDAPSTGLRSAFVARFIGNLFRKLVGASDHIDLGEILGRLNRTIATHDYFERVSMQAAEFDLLGGVVHIASAGHPYPVHYSARRNSCDILPVRGDLLHGPAGETPDTERYDQYGVEIGPGDVLVFVTDGLTEGHLLQGDPYGYRFTEIVEGRAKEGSRAIGESILDSWKAHPREEDSADDVSIIVVRLGAISGKMPAPASGEGGGANDEFTPP